MRQRRSDGSSTPPAEPLPAEPIGPYQLLGVLGSGTMGAVYRARHQDSGRVVALKTIHAADEGLLPAMRREVLALAQLHHPGIVTVVGVGTERGFPWYAMELIEGPTLRDYRQALWSQQPASPGEAPSEAPEVVPSKAPSEAPAVVPSKALKVVLSVARRLCITLAYLHGEGLVHRDLKPSNVVLRDGVSPVLVDFGVSAWLGSASGREALEQHHANAGTLAYMSPEALRGEALDARADLYSFGCILYELLCGAPPFTGKRFNEIISGHLKRPPVPPSQHVPRLPAVLDELVLGLLAKSPQERIGYAADVAAVLAELGAAGGDGDGAPPARPYLYRADCVGREDIIAEVRSLLDAGLSGRAVHVLLSGEEGAGKTRLTMEISRKLGRDGVLVLMGSCRPHGPLLEGFGGPLQQIAERCRSKGQEQTERWLGRHARLLARYQPALRPLCEEEAATAADKSKAGVRKQLLVPGSGRHPLRQLRHEFPMFAAGHGHPLFHVEPAHETDTRIDVAQALDQFFVAGEADQRFMEVLVIGHQFLDALALVILAVGHKVGAQGLDIGVARAFAGKRYRRFLEDHPQFVKIEDLLRIQRPAEETLAGLEHQKVFGHQAIQGLADRGTTGAQ